MNAELILAQIHDANQQIDALKARRARCLKSAKDAVAEHLREGWGFQCEVSETGIAAKVMDVPFFYVQVHEPALCFHYSESVIASESWPREAYGRALLDESRDFAKVDVWLEKIQDLDAAIEDCRRAFKDLTRLEFPKKRQPVTL
jgi:hypothetical protein